MSDFIILFEAYTLPIYLFAWLGLFVAMYEISQSK